METLTNLASMEVSILAHLARWALPMEIHLTHLVIGFQSSPTSQGGRYTPETGDIVLKQQFQSSPTSQGGRYDMTEYFDTAINGVSILAHLARWALHMSGSWNLRRSLFQSSPTSQGGRYH